MVWLVQVMGLHPEMYIHYVMELTGITALLVMIPAIWLYRRDKKQRCASGLTFPREKSLKLWEIAGILVIGAGLAMYANLLLGMVQSFLAPSDYFETMSAMTDGKSVLICLAGILVIGAGLAMYANLLLGMVQSFLAPSDYFETMSAMTDGKSVLICLFWMGIVCPIAEEMIFRWLIFLRLRDYFRFPVACVISGVLFGVYHGDLLQGVYATVLGMVFAWLMEITGSLLSCVLLHIGANVWSVLFSTYGLFWLENGDVELLILVLGVLLFSLLVGIPYFKKKYGKEKIRTV